MCDFDLYIEQYKNGLLTKEELVERLSKSIPEPESESVREYTQINLDILKAMVVNDYCCHWLFFLENCPESELDSFCNVNFVRNEFQTRAFVLQYI